MIEQIGIALTGVIAIFLSQSKHVSLQRYACFFGLAAQPFWFYAAWTAQQWGILFMGVLYTAAWGKGLWTHWFAPQPCPHLWGEWRMRELGMGKFRVCRLCDKMDLI
jgi:hypothetical protein